MAVPVQALLKHWSYRLFAPDKMLQHSYDAFRRLLEQDSTAHTLMAEFEELFHNDRYEDLARVGERYQHFSQAVLAMVESLEQMNPTEANSLRQYFTKFDFYIRFLLAPPEQFTIPPYVVSLDEQQSDAVLGNKGYNLVQLKEHGLAVPDGFVITTTAYFALIEKNNLRVPINSLLAQLDPLDHEGCVRISAEIQALILKAHLPLEVTRELEEFTVSCKCNDNFSTRLAVRSSAEREDGTYSFAGQYESILGVVPDELPQAYLKVIASKYSVQALLYRIHLGFMDEETPLAVVVQNMVEAAISGVIYTQLPYGDASDQYLLIECIHGLGDLLVSGQEIPETYLVHRTSFDIQLTSPSSQKERLVSTRNGVQRQPLEKKTQQSPMLSQEQVVELARKALRIEKHFAGVMQDIEWSIDDQGQVLFLQSRPLSASAGQALDLCQAQPAMEIEGEIVFAGGVCASRGAVAGPVSHFLNQGSSNLPLEASIFLVKETPPSLVAITERALGIIAEKGAIAGHFSTVCREKGIPLLVHAERASTHLREGQTVTLDASHCKIFSGNISGQFESLSHLNGQKQQSYHKRIGAILRFITPLQLTDPRAESFSPQGCRSMHDIIRFSHERSLSSMFFLGDMISGKSQRAKKIRTELPIDLYVLDLRSGKKNTESASLPVADFQSHALSALWGGLTHPSIDWESHQHFDWKSFDDVVLAGGMASTESGDLASYAIVGQGYLNVNMRFGYHFTLIDAICGADSRLNYAQIRFAGGGGEYAGRHLRIQFLEAVLQHYGFVTTATGDLIDGRLVERSQEEIYQLLDNLGKLLGATKLMDLVLREESQVPKLVSQFLSGIYSFTH
nr:PEP/pyruvate-binding domain-containing protein [uncultured Desulfobulbus sp.]